MKIIRYNNFHNEKMDKIDKKILEILKDNSKLTNKEIGRKVFLTGQAVGVRISNMLDEGTIERFTISISNKSRETQFIRLFLKDTYFKEVENIINQYDNVQNFYKIRGQACYMIIAHFNNHTLNHFLENISSYARYNVEVAISEKN